MNARELYDEWENVQAFMLPMRDDAERTRLAFSLFIITCLGLESQAIECGTSRWDFGEIAGTEFCFRGLIQFADGERCWFALHGDRRAAET